MGESGAVPGPNPAQVHTAAELASALKQLRGSRTFRELVAAGRQAGRTDLPRESTVSDLVRAGRCSRETLEGFLAMCQVPRSRHEAWLKAWERTREPRGPRGAVRVRDAGWKRLGVHDPIQVPGADPDTLPVYVPRDIDDEPEAGLRARLAAAAVAGGFVVLVGESSTGKTRCLMEAVRMELGEWWLLRPTGPQELEEWAAEPPPRLVLWLDELQNYLGGGPVLSAATAARLIDGGCVLVGTLWPSYQDCYRTLPDVAFGTSTAAGESVDANQQQRQVLQLAHVVRLPAHPTDDENQRARALANPGKGDGDPRLREALRQREYGFTQAIAAVPQLVERWHNANPYARAVLSAAVDAIRFGVRTPLSDRLLQDAAAGYCTPAERGQARPDWFDSALAYLTQPLHGAARALTPVSTSASTMGKADGYRIADYLRQHIGEERESICPPASFWDACQRHLPNGADVERVADNARRRLRYLPAAGLYRRAVDLGFTAARFPLAELLADQHQIGKAIELLQQFLSSFPDTDDAPYATVRLADLLSKLGRIDEAITLLRNLLRQQTDTDVYDFLHTAFVAEHLASLMEENGQIESAVALLSGLAPWRDPGHLFQDPALAELLARHQLTTDLASRAAAGDPFAEVELAAIEPPSGDLDEVIDALRELAEGGNQAALIRLAEVYEREIGDLDEAMEVLRDEADLADSSAAEAMNEILFMINDAETLQQRTEDGDSDAVHKLAGVLARRGNLAQAMQILREHADAGYADASPIADWIAIGLTGYDDDSDESKAKGLRTYDLTADGEIAIHPYEPKKQP